MSKNQPINHTIGNTNRFYTMLGVYLTKTIESGLLNIGSYPSHRYII